MTAGDVIREARRRAGTDTPSPQLIREVALESPQAREVERQLAAEPAPTVTPISRSRRVPTTPTEPTLAPKPEPKPEPEPEPDVRVPTKTISPEPKPEPKPVTQFFDFSFLKKPEPTPEPIEPRITLIDRARGWLFRPTKKEEEELKIAAGLVELKDTPLPSKETLTKAKDLFTRAADRVQTIILPEYGREIYGEQVERVDSIVSDLKRDPFPGSKLLFAARDIKEAEKLSLEQRKRDKQQLKDFEKFQEEQLKIFEDSDLTATKFLAAKSILEQRGFEFEPTVDDTFEVKFPGYEKAVEQYLETYDTDKVYTPEEGVGTFIRAVSTGFITAPVRFAALGTGLLIDPVKEIKDFGEGVTRLPSQFAKSPLITTGQIVGTVAFTKAAVKVLGKKPDPRYEYRVFAEYDVKAWKIPKKPVVVSKGVGTVDIEVFKTPKPGKPITKVKVQEYDVMGFKGEAFSPGFKPARPVIMTPEALKLMKTGQEFVSIKAKDIKVLTPDKTLKTLPPAYGVATADKAVVYLKGMGKELTLKKVSDVKWLEMTRPTIKATRDVWTPAKVKTRGVDVFTKERITARDIYYRGKVQDIGVPVDVAIGAKQVLIEPVKAIKVPPVPKAPPVFFSPFDKYLGMFAKAPVKPKTIIKTLRKVPDYQMTITYLKDTPFKPTTVLTTPTKTAVGKQAKQAVKGLAKQTKKQTQRQQQLTKQVKTATFPFVDDVPSTISPAMSAAIAEGLKRSIVMAPRFKVAPGMIDLPKIAERPMVETLPVAKQVVGVDEKLRVQPVLDVGFEQVTDPVTEFKPATIVEPAVKVAPMTRVSPAFVPAVDVAQTTKVTDKVLQKVVPRTAEITRTVPPVTPVAPFLKFPTFKIPFPFRPEKDLVKRIKPSKLKPSVQYRDYAPSLVAVAERIKLPKRRRRVKDPFTGFELRPILT